jgi:hypothetical protein
MIGVMKQLGFTFPALRNFAWQQGYGALSVGISQGGPLHKAAA